MFLPWAAAVTLGVAWVEITGGLPPHDDITTVQFGDHADELWVGTFKGRIWHTDDGGKSYRLSFWPIESEAMIEPHLTNYRAPSVGDLARGTDRDLSPRDRRSMAERAGDLAGSVRARPRDRGTAVLSEVTRRVKRDRVRVKYIAKCPQNYMFMFTSESVWRTNDKGVHWQRLAMGPMGKTDTVRWVSCSHAQPGHMVINTDGGPLESFDWGDSFGLWKNPYPKSILLPIAGPGENDLLYVQHDHRLYQEQKDGSYKELAHIIGDSVESSSINWTWNVPEWGLRYVWTNDGFLIQDENGTRRPPEERVARMPIRFPWVNHAVEGHMLVANEFAVYESFDAGESFEHVFSSPTERTIIRIMLHSDRPGDLIVVTGGQLWRRVWEDDAHRWEDARTTKRRVDKILRAAPLWQTVQTSLGRFDLRADQIAATRHNVHLRSLLPTLKARMAFAERPFSTREETFGQPDTLASDIPGVGDAGHTIWSVFVLWDLRDLILDPFQTSRSWVDVERLRQRVTWGVQDAWAKWARSLTVLVDPTLTVPQRVFHELSRREAAAYLYQMTGGMAAFEPETPAGASP